MEKTGKYELLYIVHPDLEGSIDKITGKVKTFIKKRDGKVTYEENWGKKKLAYEINKADVGIYILWYFEAPKEKIQKIERDLKITEGVMRFMILRLEEKIQKTAKKKEKKITEKTEPTEKKASIKAKEEKAKTPETKESEKERMEKIDEKLGELLDGKEDGKKDDEDIKISEAKATEVKNKKGGKK